ncbi:MAG: TetR/AcrR family transcriptional regulator [Rubricoccaceae bacterium]|nr:TetR/AcrR family transcriptional regulator [Rubricoccaceae bacterium]
MEVSTLSRRERERLARRRAMLDAALAVFAEKGYAGATLDEVAERAEFGKGTLYNYFPGGKEEILFALIDDAYDGMVALVETYFGAHEAGTPARELFHGFIARFLAHFIERQAVFMLLIKEAQRLMFDDEARRATHLFRLRERLADALARPIEAAMARGALRPHDPRAVAHLLMGNIHGLLMAATCAPEGEAPIAPDPEIGADFITEILFDGLLAEPGRA